MECPICLEVIENQYTNFSSCVHYTCVKCWGQMLNMETADRCPVCRQEITSYQIRKIKNINIKSYIEKFSKWIGETELDNKDYQLDAIKWCLNHELNPKSIFNAKCGGILADEMGLGKTIIMLGLTLANPTEHTLIVCPPILLEQWENCIFTITKAPPPPYKKVGSFNL